MTRARLRSVVQQPDGDVVAGATVKLFVAGTGVAAGASATGTPYAPSIFAAIVGGSPIPPTLTTDSRGQITVWTDTPQRLDIGIEQPNEAAIVYPYETWELDPTAGSGGVVVPGLIDFGTFASPGLAFTLDPPLGVYRHAADTLGVAGGLNVQTKGLGDVFSAVDQAGNTRFSVGQASITAGVPIAAPSVSLTPSGGSAPHMLGVTGDPTVGLWWPTTAAMGVRGSLYVKGSRVDLPIAQFEDATDVTRLRVSQSQVLLGLGTSIDAPPLSFYNEPTLGIDRAAVDMLAITGGITVTTRQAGKVARFIDNGGFWLMEINPASGTPTTTPGVGVWRGSKRKPGIGFIEGAPAGFYLYTAGGSSSVLDISTPLPIGTDTEEFVLIGQGNASTNGMITITKDGTASLPYPAAKSGLVVYQGTAGFPVTPTSTGAVRGEIIVAGANGTYAGGNFSCIMHKNSDVAATLSGYGIGITASATGGAAFLNPTPPTGCGIIGAKFVAQSTFSGNPQTMTGVQVNVDSNTANDLLHGMEIDLGAPFANTPSSRVWMILATKAGTSSIRGLHDAFIAMCIKPGGGTVHPVTYGILFGNTFDEAGTFPFDNTSTVMKASPGGAVNRGIDFGNLTFVNQAFRSPGFGVTKDGWVACGVASQIPSLPLHVNAATGPIMEVENVQQSPNVVGGATADLIPARPLFYAYIRFDGVSYRIPVFG